MLVTGRSRVTGQPLLSVLLQPALSGLPSLALALIVFPMARSALPISCTHCIRRLLAPAILSASLSVSHGLSICQLRSLFHTRIPNTCIYLLRSQNDKILPKVTQRCSAAYNDTIDNLISLIRFHQFSESSLPWYSLITTITCTLYPNFTALSSMWSKLAFAAFVLTLLTHSKKFTVVQAQTLLQPRDALPNQSNLTQDEILPHDYLTSLSFANTSDTYLDSEANLEHTIVARKNPPQPLTRHPPPVNYVVVFPARADDGLLFSSIMYTGSTHT